VRCGDELVVLDALDGEVDGDAEALERGRVGVPEEDLRVDLGALHRVLPPGRGGDVLERAEEARWRGERE
jgi:hypothetical protein